MTCYIRRLKKYGPETYPGGGGGYKWAQGLNTDSGQKFVHLKVMHITPMLNTLIESQDVNSNLDTLFHFFTEYERKYICDAIVHIISVPIDI